MSKGGEVMAKWLATISVVVEAESRKGAWKAAEKVAEAHNGNVRSIPQKPADQLYDEAG
jgi:ribosome recycling factor